MAMEAAVDGDAEEDVGDKEGADEGIVEGATEVDGEASVAVESDVAGVGTPRLGRAVPRGTARCVSGAPISEIKD